MLKDRRLGKKFVILVLVGMVLPLLYYTFSWPRSTPPAGKLKMIHREQYFPSNETSTVVYMDRLAPPTTPTTQSMLAEHVWRTCRKQGELPTDREEEDPDYYKHILVDDRYKVLYCYVPKVACTNWRRVMLVLSGKVKVKNLMDISAFDTHNKYKSLLRTLGDFSPTEITYRLDNYYKFMFVREPFERLLSAWRNKFLSNMPSSVAFRKSYLRSFQRLFKNPSQGRASLKTGSGPDTGTVPFSKFLQYLVHPARKEEMNEHWERFHELCHPCSIQYDFIGKYETIDEGADHVLRSVHADHVVNFPKRSTQYHYNRTSTYLKDYFQDLPPTLLKQVYELYRLDFELFDYSVPEELLGLFRAEDQSGVR